MQNRTSLDEQITNLKFRIVESDNKHMALYQDYIVANDKAVSKYNDLQDRYD